MLNTKILEGLNKGRLQKGLEDDFVYIGWKECDKDLCAVVHPAQQIAYQKIWEDNNINNARVLRVPFTLEIIYIEKILNGGILDGEEKFWVESKTSMQVAVIRGTEDDFDDLYKLVSIFNSPFGIK